MKKRSRKQTIAETPGLCITKLVRQAREQPQGNIRWNLPGGRHATLRYVLQSDERILISYRVSTESGPQDVHHPIQIAYQSRSFGDVPFFRCKCGRDVRKLYLIAASGTGELLCRKCGNLGHECSRRKGDRFYHGLERPLQDLEKVLQRLETTRSPKTLLRLNRKADEAKKRLSGFFRQLENSRHRALQVEATPSKEYATSIRRLLRAEQDHVRVLKHLEGSPAERFVLAIWEDVARRAGASVESQGVLQA